MRVQARLLALLAAGGAIALLNAAPVHAQQAPATMMETHAAKSRGTGADANIKTESAPNKPDASVPAPASKGGARTRGAVAVVHVDNRTTLYIKVYLDGSYSGTLSPWGDLYFSVDSGNRTLYARADFTDQTYTIWGPAVAYVDGTYTWRLWP
ncbi:MAG: hypothetical protein DMD29_00160 [Gemmatimonadetes bacterium]|nr:MAG: hypothetical protein DMD29_00160 [Gemmatimonadota bacterium]